MLSQRLAELFKLTAGGTGQPPRPDHILIGEVNSEIADDTGCPIVSEDNLFTPEDYEDRFAELMSMGYAWLNLSYCGLWAGKGLVLVEVPSSFPESSSSTRITSVNYSGPTRYVAEANWDARGLVLLKG